MARLTLGREFEHRLAAGSHVLASLASLASLGRLGSLRGRTWVPCEYIGVLLEKLDGPGR